MSTPVDVADAVLDALVAALPGYDRAVLAPGPTFARDCRMLAVHLGDLLDAPLVGCGAVTDATVGAHVVRDCVPAPSKAGDRVTLPTAEAITDWTREFLADVWAAHVALGALVDSVNGEGKALLGRPQFRGPGSGVSEAEWTVTVQLDGL